MARTPAFDETQHPREAVSGRFAPKPQAAADPAVNAALAGQGAPPARPTADLAVVGDDGVTSVVAVPARFAPVPDSTVFTAPRAEGETTVIWVFRDGSGYDMFTDEDEEGDLIDADDSFDAGAYAAAHGLDPDRVYPVYRSLAAGGEAVYSRHPGSGSELEAGFVAPIWAEDPADHTDRSLRRYADLRNGEVYGVATADIRPDGSVSPTTAYRGYLGLAHAEKNAAARAAEARLARPRPAP